jgi:hypothetical protein
MRTAIGTVSVVAFLLAQGYAWSGDIGLELQLGLKNNRYHLSDDIELDIRLRNIGSVPVAIFGEILWGYQGGMVLHVETIEGGAVGSDFIEHDRINPAALKDDKSYVLLRPRHYFGTTRKDKIENLFVRPGVYRIWLEYLSPVPEGFAPVEHLWSRTQGSIHSDVAVLEVVA